MSVYDVQTKFEQVIVTDVACEIIKDLGFSKPLHQLAAFAHPHPHPFQQAVIAASVRTDCTGALRNTGKPESVIRNALQL